MLVAVIAGASGVGAWRWITRERPIAVETAVVSERPAGAQAAILNATGYVTAVEPPCLPKSPASSSR
jgi:hypothetical protein